MSDPFVWSDPLGDKLKNSLSVGLFLQHDYCLWNLSSFVVRVGNNGSVGNTRMTEKDSLELCGRNLEALILN